MINENPGDFKLSEHFTFFELTNSADHPELVELNREAALSNPSTMKSLRALCNIILEPVRKLAGAPLIITSGFRCQALNRVTKGASRWSQHSYGAAADFTVKNGNMGELFENIRVAGREGQLEWHQLRYYPLRNFIHISLPTDTADMQVEMVMG